MLILLLIYGHADTGTNKSVLFLSSLLSDTIYNNTKRSGAEPRAMKNRRGKEKQGKVFGCETDMNHVFFLEDIGNV